jgi:hypothetical protein
MGRHIDTPSTGSSHMTEFPIGNTWRRAPCLGCGQIVKRARDSYATCISPHRPPRGSRTLRAERREGQQENSHPSYAIPSTSAAQRKTSSLPSQRCPAAPEGAAELTRRTHRCELLLPSAARGLVSPPRGVDKRLRRLRIINLARLGCHARRSGIKLRRIGPPRCASRSSSMPR